MNPRPLPLPPETLEARLAYTWRDKSLLTQALTHSSAGKPDYQRLEFLGDRVLGLVVSEVLMERYPEASEGELGRRHAALVREETLAIIGREWHLGDVMRLGGGERTSGGANKPAILADIVEAVLGAMYLDGGMDALRARVRADWHDLINDLDGRDAKTRLQEVLQARHLALPHYLVLEESGPDHEKYFRVRVSCGLGSGDGEGRSKRTAEMAAAAALVGTFLNEDEGDDG